ncbi:MAG: hypothetical protein J3K34DRAFT_523205 [Monoraphidium minutum]|nr:MAG: hypothetical protein J3K34DRAFT_523205 [Monoraphidium minutum]
MKGAAMLAVLLLTAASAVHAEPPKLTICKALAARLNIQVKGSTLFCPTDEGWAEFAEELGFGEAKAEDEAEAAGGDEEAEGAKEGGRRRMLGMIPTFDELQDLPQPLQHFQARASAAPAAAPKAARAGAAAGAAAAGGALPLALGKLGQIAAAAGAAAGAAAPRAPGAAAASALGLAESDPVAKMLKAIPAATLKQVFQQHVVPGRVLPASSFKEGDSEFPTLLPGAPLKVTKDDDEYDVSYKGSDIDEKDDGGWEDEDIKAVDLTFEGPYRAGASSYVVHAVEETLVPRSARAALLAVRAAAMGEASD